MAIAEMDRALTPLQQRGMEGLVQDQGIEQALLQEVAPDMELGVRMQHP